MLQVWGEIKTTGGFITGPVQLHRESNARVEACLLPSRIPAPAASFILAAALARDYPQANPISSRLGVSEFQS